MTKITPSATGSGSGTFVRLARAASSIDGGHTADEVYSDAVLCWPLLKVGGVVCFDDYEWRLHRPVEKRPQQGIDKFLDEHRDELEILHKAYTVMARRIR